MKGQYGAQVSQGVRSPKESKCVMHVKFKDGGDDKLDQGPVSCLANGVKHRPDE